MDNDVEEFLELVQKLGSSPGKLLARGDEADCHRMAYVAQQYSTEKIEMLARRHASQPQMMVFIADGWAADVGHTTIGRVASALVRRTVQKILPWI